MSNINVHSTRSAATNRAGRAIYVPVEDTLKKLSKDGCTKMPYMALYICGGEAHAIMVPARFPGLVDMLISLDNVKHLFLKTIRFSPLLSM